MTNIRRFYQVLLEKVTRKERVWQITRKQTLALLHCLHFLKIHALYTGIFVSQGNQRRVQKVFLYLHRGDASIASYLHEHCSPRECACAVNMFLLRKRPLLPTRVQKLLAAKNYEVTTKMIALDALGLILQEFYNTNNLKVLYSLLDVMKVLSTVGSLRPTEIRVSHAPYILLPLFFEEKPEVLLNWKRVCDTLNEMVMMVDLLLTPDRLSCAIAETKRGLLNNCCGSQRINRKKIVILKNPTYYYKRRNFEADQLRLSFNPNQY